MSRYSIACHEAGHCVAALLLGQAVDGASIELRGDHAAGVVSHRRTDEFPFEDGDPTSPPFRMGWRLRYELDRNLAITLAGPSAEKIYGGAPPLGYQPAPADEQHVRDVLARRATLPPATQALFEDVEADGRPTDFEKAYETAAACSSGIEYAQVYLNWFSLEVDGWVASPGFRYPLRRVVEALLAHGELSGDEVEAIVNTAPRRVTANAYAA